VVTDESTSTSILIRRGNVLLAAELLLPAGSAPFPCVIFVHGLGSGKDSPRNVVVASHLVDAGIAALLFDLSGHGESGDDPRDGQEAFVEDLEAAFDWTRSRPDIDAQRIGVAGSSLGGIVALEAIRRRLIHPSVLVLRAPPAESHQFAHLDVPTLVIVGDQDLLLKQVRGATSTSEWATLSVVHGAGHLFEEPGTLEQAVERTVDWFKQHFTGEPAPTYEFGEVD
jgi:putative phosphoribosyl transferase